MKKNHLLVIMVLMMALLGSPAGAEKISGKCLLLDDIARFDPVFGTYVHLVFRPTGSAETITFVSSGTTGTGTLCPPNASDPPFQPVEAVLIFRIEPTVSALSENDIVLYALEALSLIPAEVFADTFETGDTSAWTGCEGPGCVEAP